jgi:hypothetical protein
MGWVRVNDGFVFQPDDEVRPVEHKPEIKKNIVPLKIEVEEIQEKEQEIEEIQEAPKMIIQPKTSKKKYKR